MLDQIVKSINNFPERNAFFIQNKFYTYSALAQKVSNIKKSVETVSGKDEKLIGYMTYDNLDTYASALGILFTEKGYVPINPENPADRNISIVEQAEIKTILTSRDDESTAKLAELPGVRVINTTQIADSEINLTLPDVTDEDIAYLLFTSGSTGVPKGVPLSRKNLYSFADAYEELGYTITEEDRVLQMFDMTFDLSIMSYLIPLCKGACVYTVPFGGIKYTYVYSLLEEQELTVALMVPSIIAYLRPYFEEIKLDKMKHSMFCGEALYEDIVSEWMNCVPNALVQNVYGPTEATIFCLTYNLSRDRSKVKHINGIVCIGKPMKNMGAAVADENGNLFPEGEKGELCLSGYQLTDGYWKNPEKNQQAFFTKNINGKDVRFYRTGDLAYIDKDGDYMFCGRVDHQIKIQGYRVELSEIEHHAREFTKIANVAAVASDFAGTGNVKIHLFVENYSGNTERITDYLNTKVPKYMIPSTIQNIQTFPLNVNGKIDRKKLLTFVQN